MLQLYQNVLDILGFYWYPNNKIDWTLYE
jgi:hypothetical protein